MKKEARLEAEKLYLRSGGKSTNREIADAVRVNALTVGRWKRDHDWVGKLKEMEDSSVNMGAPVIVRKKAARDMAVSLYIGAGGNITNKDLADKVDVSPATISKWKEQDEWIKFLSPSSSNTMPSEELNREIEIQEFSNPEYRAQPDTREPSGLDVGDLVSPEQIIELNRRIDDLLKRGFLTATELADVAAAKTNLLDAVQTYLSIVREMGEMNSEG